MTLRLVNEYTSQNLGDAVIYETLAQLAGPLGAATTLTVNNRRHVRGVVSQADIPLRASDVHVSVGGDIFNNAKPLLPTRRFMQNLYVLAKPPADRTFLFGQSIPHSCRGLPLHLLARVLRRLSSVTVRDIDSFDRLRSLGVRASLSYDIALGYTPAATCHAAGAALFSRAGIDPSRAVLMSVRAFDSMYPHDNHRFVAQMAALAQRLLDRGHLPVILMQSLAQGADNDHAVAAKLQQVVPGLGLMDPFDAEDLHHPIDSLVGALALSRAVVAVRFHTAVLRLLGGRIPYNLPYSAKGADLGQRLDLPGTPLQHLDIDLAVAGIESSIDRVYDIRPLRTDVSQQFAAALAHALGVQPAAALRGEEFAIR